jgi:hypothetical protein
MSSDLLGIKSDARLCGAWRECAGGAGARRMVARACGSGVSGPRERESEDAENSSKPMTEFKELWDGLQLLNDIWMRELSNLEHLRDQTQMLPIVIFSSAHARFLTAVELAFSCCIGDAYSTLRDGIEAVAHAHKILTEPATAGVWCNKHKGKAEELAYKKVFEEKKKDNLFPDKHGLRQLMDITDNFRRWLLTVRSHPLAKASKICQRQAAFVGLSNILRLTRNG